MSSFHQVLIGGYPSGGLMQDRKPLMLPDQAFSELENAFVWRERVRKRVGSAGVGQLSQIFSNQGLGNSPGSDTWTFSIFTKFSITDTYATIALGSVTITVGPDTFTDQGNGTLKRQDGDTSSTINYITSSVTLNRTVATINAGIITFTYYPGLPVMGIWKQYTSTQGIDTTLYFDTKYAYQFTGGVFQRVGTATWTAPNLANGTNTQFFWAYNYQGTDASQLTFFVTNNYDPIRYTGTSLSGWTDFKPALTSAVTPPLLLNALIVIPYYGRLLALNTTEGTNVSSQTYFARCRFSQIGNPLATNAWYSDVAGLGGFLDAPTNEQITGAIFFRNTLIVFFEYSTWQLRYIGEYGIPFIFERISSDFGSNCTFSPINFDQGALAVSERGIIQASAQGVSRIDEQIPETIFGMEIQNEAQNFTHGIRDFEKEVVYWNYLDVTDAGSQQNWPTKTLLFNYRNNTWAQFRDTITCFGKAQFQKGITWDSMTTSWNSISVTWDNVDDQNYVDYIVAGNQQGFINIYENEEATPQTLQVTDYAPSLFVYAFTTGSPATFTVPNHNLKDGELIYLTGMVWNGTDPAINNAIYKVTVNDVNTISFSTWNQVDQDYDSLNILSAGTYVGGGLLALLPVMNIVSKDFNPFQGNGQQFKLSFIDFQVDTDAEFPSIPAVTVKLYVNSYLGEQANLITGNMEALASSQPSGYITNIALTNPCRITSPGHSLTSGTQITINNIVGTTQVNNASYTITVVDANNFTLNGIDATGFTTYVSGGIWNTNTSLGQTYIPGSQYAWYRFYSTQYGQYLRVALTYDDNLMNQIGTHQSDMQLNAMNCWMKQGARIIN